MKKTLLLAAATVLALNIAPAMADGHKKGGDHKGKMFEKHDTNGDGQISEAEFLAHAKEKFTKMDANSDGVVTKEEGKAAKKAKREMRKDRKADKAE